MIYTVVANTGIHITSFPFEINTKEKFQLWFHEWYNTENGEWTLGLVQEINDETNQYFYNKKTLFENGYLQILKSEEGVNVQDLYDEGIKPIMINDEMQATGNIFKLSFVDKSNVLSKFENKWLPIPYFYHRSETKFKFGSLNWSRFKLLPTSDSEGIKKYKVLLALDTRTKEKTDKYEECPVFPDQFATELRFDVCPQEFQLMDFCSPNPEWEYINDYLFKLVHPELSSVGKIKQGHKLTYIATYFLLIDYIAQKKLFPQIILYRDKGTVVKDVDMVVDIGNSRTAALLVFTCKKLLMTKKKLPVRFTGQHFTIDKVLIKDAIRQANISNQDTVLDIGAGKGFLTVHLLKIANNVVAIENDTALVEHLRKLFSDARNVQVVGCDFRNFAVPKFPFKVVSNIPYGITSDIFKILMFESLGNFLGGSIVLQLEPTQKLFSRKLYNPYTVFYHTFFDLKLVYEVGPESFLPPPTVKSALLNIKRKHLFFDFKFKAKYLAFISCLLEKPDLSVKTALKSIFRKSQVRSISEKFGLNLNAQIVCLSPSQWLNCFLEMLEVVPEKFHPS